MKTSPLFTHSHVGLKICMLLFFHIIHWFCDSFGGNRRAKCHKWDLNFFFFLSKMIGWTCLYCVFKELVSVEQVGSVALMTVLRKGSEQEDCGRKGSRMGWIPLEELRNALSSSFYMASLSVYFTRQEQVDEETNLSLPIVWSLH